MWLKTALDLFLGFVLAVFYGLEKVVVGMLPLSWRAKDVSGDIVLITGGGSGLGRLMAIRFANLGSVVVLLDVNSEGNDETVKQVEAVGGRAHAYKCDLSKREEIYSTAEKVKEEVGVVTILVNNAGIVVGKDLLDIPDHMVVKIFDVNILAHFWTTKAFLPGMLEKDRGHIVTIASLAGYFGSNRMVDYCSTKFAAIGFDESLHAELIATGHPNIHTTCVCPFFVNTGMFDGVYSKVISTLSPDYVVDEIVKGVLVNEEILIVPRIFLPLIWLKSFFCRKSFVALGNSLGGYDMMTRFRGRTDVTSADVRGDKINCGHVHEE